MHKSLNLKSILVLFCLCFTNVLLATYSIHTATSYAMSKNSVVNEPQLSADQIAKLHQYAKSTVRYFTNQDANNLSVGFTHAFYGKGKFQECTNGSCQEAAWDLTRGYGSHVNINEVTLRFLSLAVAHKMDWLDGSESENYENSWGQIYLGLQTLRGMQLSGNLAQINNGRFYRAYLTTDPTQGDIDRTIIIRDPGVDTVSSDDNGLPYMNLLILEGLAQDAGLTQTQRTEIIELSQAIRANIALSCFVVDNKIVHNFDVTDPDHWDRMAAEGPIILTALMLSEQIDWHDFNQIVPSLENYPVDWGGYNGTIPIEVPSFHSAMFIHGLRAIHGLPVTPVEGNVNFFGNSTYPVFKAHLDYAEEFGYQALGSQVMTQSLDGIPLFETETQQIQFAGNEQNIQPSQGISRATAPHAWFIPLSRWNYLEQNEIDLLFTWMAAYEAKFFHENELGWEAAIPWTHDDTTNAWSSSDGEWKYTDWGRPHEALNSAYIVLSAFDALIPERPLASYNIESQQTAFFAAYYDGNVTSLLLPIIRK